MCGCSARAALRMRWAVVREGMYTLYTYGARNCKNAPIPVAQGVFGRAHGWQHGGLRRTLPREDKHFPETP